jgi:hypothetical protein
MLPVLLTARASAEQVLHVDATAAPPTAVTGYLHMGTPVSRAGHRLDINSRYLSLDGKPWLPVMGEFHFARVPAADWDAELSKMKAAGVSIVSTYVFWNYHEAQPGVFDWRDDRDLRHFVELCAKHGLYVMLRIGPWAHGEVRYGGIPDWVVQAMPTRRDDATYLHYVDRFYRQIAAQLGGLWWKDNGPIISVQIENEYNASGPGQGAEHIAHLKAMARAAGMDAPLYTVTGWDGTVFPLHDVVPVFGGYPDEPWSTSNQALPANETYAFRFDTRVSGADLGAQTKSASKGDADASAPYTPFLSAEFGGGVPAMYRRRVVMAPDDIASMLPVQLGSGINLYGYYMFQGGRNLVGPTTLEENTLIGGFNDTPIVSYDFQAPLGQYGQERPVLDRLRPFHYFLQAFGDRLASMAVHAPATLPASSADLKTPRYAVRSLGDSGFVFLNNHVRQYAMPTQQQVRFSVKLPHGTLAFPRTPIDIPADAYFIWPFNFDMDGAHLRYATAQPMARLQNGNDVTYVFVASDGIVPELAFDAGTEVSASTGKIERTQDATLISALHPGTAAAITLHGDHGHRLQVLILNEAQARQAWLRQAGGVDQLWLTAQQIYFDHDVAKLSAIGDTHFRFATYPALSPSINASLPLRNAGQDGLFTIYEAQADARAIHAQIKPVRDALPVPPVRIGGAAQAPMQPIPETFGDAAAWSIELHAQALDGLRDAYLQIDYQGDIGRLFAGTALLDDNYYNGQAWQIGLRRFASTLKAPWTLTVLPLRADSPIYIQAPYRPSLKDGEQVARVIKVEVVPAYGLDVRLDSKKVQGSAPSPAK